MIRSPLPAAMFDSRPLITYAVASCVTSPTPAAPARTHNQRHMNVIANQGTCYCDRVSPLSPRTVLASTQQQPQQHQQPQQQQQPQCNTHPQRRHRPPPHRPHPQSLKSRHPHHALQSQSCHRQPRRVTQLLRLLPPRRHCRHRRASKTRSRHRRSHPCAPAKHTITSAQRCSNVGREPVPLAPDTVL